MQPTNLDISQTTSRWMLSSYIQTPTSNEIAGEVPAQCREVQFLIFISWTGLMSSRSDDEATPRYSSHCCWWSNFLAQPIRPSKACAVIWIYGLVLEMSSLPSVQNNKSKNSGPVKSIGPLDYTRITFKMLVPEGSGYLVRRRLNLQSAVFENLKSCQT